MFKQGDHWVLGFGSGHTVDRLSQASSKERQKDGMPSSY
jgi:hypothetical protein